ncbi:hypothetical protein N7447_008993 [Penicillium robsamsonii]|uniref:uncharacterized protein n=1 Tax=Penicillium robsamsonii TaxID=1792511 RepID=UPI002547313C|nr:uncharacterized protein N7447_008993 [Penicillium robsamsonii]KAJ5816760.1 hypothetical protein N7447_008993 [Penicillium robsamsonii]
MDTEHLSQPTLPDTGGNEAIQSQGKMGFRPRRAKWACFACHKRKVRCDALNQGTSCTNCKLDMKECVAPPRRKKAASSKYMPSAKTPLSQHSPDPTCNVQSNSTGVSQKRKTEPRSLGSRTNPKRQRPEEDSHNVNNEVGRWMDMLPPSVLEQLELRSTKHSSRPHRETIELKEQFHHQCSEKLLQAVDILTEVIIMHNALSAHGPSVPIAYPAESCTSEKQSDTKENMDYSSPCQVGENIWDAEKTVDEGLALTPESLEYVAGSNFNIWLELNDFDLEGPSSLGLYDAEEAGSWRSSQ